MANEGLATDIALRIDPICQAFEAAWKGGEQPSLDAFVEQADADDRGPLRAELARIERLYRRELQASTDSDSASSTISTALSDRSAVDAADPYKTAPTPPGMASCSTGDMPARFGQYEVVSVLGEGGFGVVYRGRDPDLNRDVAIKVPHRERLSSPDDIQLFLAEARVLASLNHPGIVPVYYFGRGDDGLCYVVSQFMPGGDLATLIQRKRPSHSDAVELLSHIAEAVGHAHQHGLVHRDIKPGNILIDEKGHPLVADFGLALTDDLYGEHPGLVGTPAYMSPEQACGDGHVVDVRSDIYSLGVVFYELLTGRRPYRRQETLELLNEIYRGDTRPPRQLDHTVPPELEEIRLKAMAKVPAERYTTAFDLAEDLRRWQGQEDATHGLPSQRPLAPPDTEVTFASATSPRSRNLSVILGCGGLLTISITATAAALLAFVGLNRGGDSLKQVAMVKPALNDSKRALPLPRPMPIEDEVAKSDSMLAEYELEPAESIPNKERDSNSTEPIRNIGPPMTIGPSTDSAPSFIRFITITHHARRNGSGSRPRGVLGRHSFSLRLGDQVTIYAELPRPTYAYLVAFRPDGVVEVCAPNDDSTPPPRTDLLYYPPAKKPNDRYGLSDGVGLYVFAVLASETPLPSFRDFTAQHKPEWSPHEAIPGTVWWFDGQRVEALYPKDDNRGKDDPLAEASKYVVEAAKWLCTDPGHQTSAAIGFGVGP